MLFTELRNVWQYTPKEISFAIEEVEIAKMTFLTKYVKGYKYRQIGELYTLYNQSNLELFEPITLEFARGKYTFVTPPVVEIHDQIGYVIEGNARFLFASKNNLKTLKVIVVRGVTESLPSTGKYSIDQILISDKKKSGSNRYENFRKELFRKIEESIHDPSTSLL